MLLLRISICALCAAVLSACASTAPGRMSATAADVPAELAPAAPSEQDRRAILAMTGEYKVTFAFDETVVLSEGYERTKPKRSGAYETVLVVEDAPGRIVLQHLLVSKTGGHVTKHWRQDWTWQAPTRFEFTEDQTWRVREIPSETTRGAWTQCVYEVSDAPRYCGTGRWNHKYGASTWTSDRSWRPLPRREYTTREDYNALNVENRHTIVPGGWTHEQDNTKVVRVAADGSSRTLVREFGFNDYIKIADFDFTPAYDYWNKTKDYWARVRAEWDARLAAGDGVRLDTKVDGMPIIEATFGQAERIAKGEAVSDAELRGVFDRYVLRPSGNDIARTR